MRILPLTLLIVAMGASEAHATGFEGKTSRKYFPEREVGRALVLEKGWLEFGLGADVKMANSYWDADGGVVEMTSDWLYTTETIEMRYGLASRVELYFDIVGHYMRLTNDVLGTDIADVGLGDPHLGVAWELLGPTEAQKLAREPLTSLALKLDYKGPAGKEAPGSYMGAPNQIQGFVMTTGTPDATASLAFKKQLGSAPADPDSPSLLGAAVEAELGYTVRFPGVAQYVLETEWSQMNGRIKPGDVAWGDLMLTLQVGPVALQGGGLVYMRNETRLGVNADDFFGVGNLEPLAGSDGWGADAKLRAVGNITRGVDLIAGVGLPLRGEDLQFFPLEDVHPTRGPTASFIFKFRY